MHHRPTLLGFRAVAQMKASQAGRQAGNTGQTGEIEGFWEKPMPVQYSVVHLVEDSLLLTSAALARL